MSCYDPQIMDGKTLQAELRKVIKLNEELSGTNAKLTSDLEALVDAAQTLQEDRGRLTTWNGLA